MTDDPRAERAAATAVPVACRLLQLRSLVAALGEAVDPPWWRTEFMSEAGMRFLERLYPRTAFKAAVNAVGKAACDAHDRATGRVGVYHLFRLPEWLEVETRQFEPSTDDDFVANLRAALGEPALLLSLLDSLRSRAVAPADTVGAIRVDMTPDRVDSGGLATIASIYFDAFSGGKQVFPYFVSPEAEK